MAGCKNQQLEKSIIKADIKLYDIGFFNFKYTVYHTFRAVEIYVYRSYRAI